MLGRDSERVARDRDNRRRSFDRFQKLVRVGLRERLEPAPIIPNFSKSGEGVGQVG